MERRFGFIHDKLDIKILILYIMQRVKYPLSINELAELTLIDDAIGYFDFAECIAELVRSEHLEDTGDGYVITEKGIKNGKITEVSLPFTVKKLAEKGVEDYNSDIKNRRRASVSRTAHNGGYVMDFSCTEGGVPVFNLSLEASDQAEADKFERVFRRDPMGFYKKLTGLLRDDTLDG
ncbi:MAG: DUF4364 family protein [Oscillospiraceae bacterium]|nr:DUF4364 family protein [Oscillospiraceae bacterium]